MAKDAVNPAHYKRSKEVLGVEVIDILEYFFGDDPLLWQVGKYLLRAGHKDELAQELGKARWYLDRRISKVAVTQVDTDCREALEAEHDGLEALYEAGEISFAVALDRARAVGTALATVPDAATEALEKAAALSEEEL